MAEALTQNLKLIGRYSILRELRRDRHTVAYLAMDPVLNRELVLKAVQLHPRRDEESVGHERIEQAFMRQAQAAGRLHHPHIVTVFDAGRVHNVGYLALERVDGNCSTKQCATVFALARCRQRISPLAWPTPLSTRTRAACRTDTWCHRASICKSPTKCRR
jgi:serine/threonine protein kinase